MFNNVGLKIKGLAAAICAMGILASVIVAISLKSALAFLAGFLISWASTFILYGFGELICCTTTINLKLDEIEKTLTAICRIVDEIKDNK